MLESERHERADMQSNLSPVEVNAGGSTFVVGAAVLPFHIVERAGDSYLFNAERVAAFRLDPNLAQRLLVYCEIDESLPLEDYELLRTHGLIGNFTGDLRDFLLDKSAKYGGCVQTLVINVIQSCNLRCGYCFAGDGSYGNSGKMGFETVKKSIDWYARQHTHSQMEVNFFGGEPLANFSLISHAVQYARTVAENQGKEISFSVTTNATLVTEEVADFLARNQFRIAVSLDGPSPVHDRNRPVASGKGSLERVLCGLRLLREAGNKPIARCTVYGETDMNEVQRYLAALGFEQVHVAKATLPHGQDDSAALAAVKKNALLEGEAVSRARREGVSVTNTVSKLADLIVRHQKQTRACGVGDKIAAVGIDGGIYACHRFTNNEDWKIGDVESGEYGTRFVDRPVDSISKCRSCWAKYLCGGGCRHDNFSSTGDAFVPPDEFCDEMKAYAEEAIIAACQASDREIFTTGAEL